ncbi:MAG: hypothetical protein A3G33_06760 [Omnitrophica bacterium RIFCSPLOWO2_12_FULL_44_17]|uniref:Histidine kinase N-terminal 7TM region domain-containing protein n=1 Tax=Candidatus Danuiimicrobium aquiferis TaxID=1801832 RepID=A0A1G1L2J4_9BACT|nr:MAG: hypothetical protein A3B72_03340 [Omnitrophica bacterium RIFCSPHIGHO2_02_FULL_45_28]OGW99382.1 MAG: hypothetical protein A3G33_06760 [Omnitrophica bacterium RIFCSPLOWO2_12_FULL_44_17]OGX03432.1 MAG: hypothetical protein A3J12_11675 [Omnitrophica bacterium RIFCSPLOWO2_02_FULL_44_11]
MNPYTFSLLFFSFCTFLIAVLIWLKRQDEVGMRYFIFCVFVGIWSSALSFVVTNQTPYGQALFCARLANMAASFISATWLHFIIVYTGYPKKFYRLLYFFIWRHFLFCAWRSRHG